VAETYPTRYAAIEAYVINHTDESYVDTGHTPVHVYCVERKGRASVEFCASVSFIPKGEDDYKLYEVPMKSFIDHGVISGSKGAWTIADDTAPMIALLAAEGVYSWADGLSSRNPRARTPAEAARASMEALDEALLFLKNSRQSATDQAGTSASASRHRKAASDSESGHRRRSRTATEVESSETEDGDSEGEEEAALKMAAAAARRLRQKSKAGAPSSSAADASNVIANTRLLLTNLAFSLPSDQQAEALREIANAGSNLTTLSHVSERLLSKRARFAQQRVEVAEVRKPKAKSRKQVMKMVRKLRVSEPDDTTPAQRTLHLTPEQAERLRDQLNAAYASAGRK